jgi:adenosylcobinamide-phosphate guanylyltransferase
MRALIMAGGEGKRLDLGEKPLILVRGEPMIGHVVRAFRDAGCEPVVAVTRKTPMTANWCRAQGVDLCRADGKGFVDDMIQAVRLLDEESPLLVSVSDIPCVTPEIIRNIVRSYASCGSDALSAWIPASLVRSCRGGMPYRETIRGVEACPAGINILRGDRIGETQEEFALLLDEPALALNVNTRADRDRAEAYLRELPDHECRP